MIRPPAGWPGLGIQEGWRYRSICIVLAHRALKVRYRQTLVGVGWALIQPLVLATVFTVFFGLFARLPTEGVPYPLFFYAGLAIWQVMAKVISEGSVSVVANAALVVRVHFPRVYFPFSVGVVSLVDLAVNGVALLALMLVFGYVPGTGVLLIPALVLIGYVTVLGAALWFSALNVAYRDIAILLPLVTQVWFFVTPLIYSATIIPEDLQAIYYLNPMALVVTGIRSSLLGTAPAPPVAWPLAIIVATLVFSSGYLFFRRREPTFADVV